MILKKNLYQTILNIGIDIEKLCQRNINLNIQTDQNTIQFDCFLCPNNSNKDLNIQKFHKKSTMPKNPGKSRKQGVLSRK